jgi:hypothetical protein
LPSKSQCFDFYRYFALSSAAIDRIINHLKLTFAAERPPPLQAAQQQLLMAAEERGEYF